MPIVPPSVNLRKQQLFNRCLSTRKNRSSSSSTYVSRVSPSVGGEGAQSGSAENDRIHRSFETNEGSVKSSLGVSSTAADDSFCNSICSSDIRNCNKRISRNFDQERATKVWRGAVNLGVEVNSPREQCDNELGIQVVTEEDCIHHI
ncbi:hypothetical protein TSUD_150880 [Trifolium subterraneum]|uniref:Uncharacterized protein n=1 Tax=Trifolium subterraneum TaxID=3900 RepID=A0A2Z6N191_TRISU|nr:hypothetical protein TSUD_150880 [Trifolium subterraneum]